MAVGATAPAVEQWACLIVVISELLEHLAQAQEPVVVHTEIVAHPWAIGKSPLDVKELTAPVLLSIPIEFVNTARDSVMIIKGAVAGILEISQLCADACLGTTVRVLMSECACVTMLCVRAMNWVSKQSRASDLGSDSHAQTDEQTHTHTHTHTHTLTHTHTTNAP
jgi:hypothetical protein